MMAGSGGGVSGDGNQNGECIKPLATPMPFGCGASERELESFVRDALSCCIMLERYPRCVVQVVVQIVQADGSVLGTAVNCAVMALMDAGVAMKGLPVASTCVVVGRQLRNNDNSDSIWIDPTAEEESAEGHTIVVLVTEAGSNDDETDKASEVITSFSSGAPMPTCGLIQCMENTDKYNKAMVAFMRMAVEQKVQKEVVTLWS
jgi:ribonuclease PH